MVVARSWPCSGLSSFSGPEDQQGGGAVADLDAVTPAKRGRSGPTSTGRNLMRRGLRSVTFGLAVWRMA